MSYRVFSGLAPIHILRAARLLLLPATLLLAAQAWLGAASPAGMAAAFYGVTMLLHLAFPRSRSADLCCVLAIAATVAVFAHAEPVGVAATRWLLALAAIGAAMAPMRAVRMRSRMTTDPYRPLAADERRRPRTRRVRPIQPSAPADTPALRLLPGPSR